MNFQALASKFALKVTLMLFSMCMSLIVAAQNYTYTAEDKFVTLVTGSTYTDTVYSSVNLFAINNFVDPFGEAKIFVNNFSKDLYQIKFSFIHSEFVGKKMFEVETFAITPSVQKKIRYNFTIVKSLVEAKDDYVKIEEGQPQVSVDPLANDVFNDVFEKKLVITDAKFGDAYVSNKYVNYQLTENFKNDVVLYTVSNFAGVSDQGAIFLYKDRKQVSDEINYEVVASNGSILIFLPKNDGTLTLNPKYGTLTKINNQVYNYKPNIGTGQAFDKFLFVVGGYKIIYNIEIKNVVKDKGQVKNDIVYTPINTATSFNVFDNDETNLNSIINFSEGLIYGGGGLFSYQPEGNFVGVKKFFYETGNKLNREIGEIEINVGNIDPSDAYVYKFDVISGSSHNFTYNLPFDSYAININSYPSHGAASAYRQNEEINLDCGSIQGKAVVSYYPMPGFVGTDEFTVKYCAGNNACKIYKLQYTVSAPSSALCDCGTDCVWPGDVNRDGVVSPSDLLTIGRNFGKMGAPRSLGSIEWKAQHGDWKEDASQADTNGDGIVDRKDAQAVAQNLGQLSALVPSAYGNDRTFPFTIVPQTTDVDSGDQIVFDIYVGSDEEPVLDAYGLSFNIRFAPGFLDSVTVVAKFFDDTWIADQSPILDFATQKQNGLLTAAISRTLNRGVSGKGIIGQVTGVVKDELEGFKDEDAEFIMQNVVASSIRMEDANGNVLNAKPVVVPIKINRKKSNIISKDDQLVLYPNPTQGDFTLSLKGQDEIKEVSIIDIAGSLVRNYKNINAKQFDVIQEGIADGIYVVRIQTTTNTILKKLNIVNSY